MRQYGNKHKISYPNRTDIRRVAEQFKGEIEDVRVIPHPKDLRSWFDFGPISRALIDTYPDIMQADVVQIYPASTDRLEAKRVELVIRTFGEIKKMGYSVMLVIANQWATGRGKKENIQRYTQIARRSGMELGEICFTSNWRKEYVTGLPKEALRELFMCSNLFLFPTREETFGLVLPEACLSGGVLPVLNKSLQNQMEISGMHADYIDFGSFDSSAPAASDPQFPKAVAEIIMGRMLRNESIMTKTYMRQR
ncbi:unnamed protein product, partial [marine sediment metagenome]